MSYTDLSVAEGRKFLPFVWGLSFKPLEEPNFFVQSGMNRDLRDCAEFRLDTERDEADEILFFVADQELIAFLTETKGELYLYGAYNQIIVCQMRAQGTVTLEDGHPETDEIKARLRGTIEPRVGSMVNKLDAEAAAKRYTILDNGLLFCFRVNAYAYAVYERG